MDSFSGYVLALNYNVLKLLYLLGNSMLHWMIYTFNQYLWSNVYVPSTVLCIGHITMLLTTARTGEWARKKIQKCSYTWWKLIEEQGDLRGNDGESTLDLERGRAYLEMRRGFPAF